MPAGLQAGPTPTALPASAALPNVCCRAATGWKEGSKGKHGSTRIGAAHSLGICLATGAAHQACRHQTALGRSPPSCHAADQELMLLLSKGQLQHTNCAGQNLAESEAFKRNESLQNSTPTNPPSYWQARSICPITIRHTGSSSTNKTRSPAGKGCLWFACSVSFPAAAAAVCSAPLTIVAITQVIVI